MNEFETEKSQTNYVRVMPLCNCRENSITLSYLMVRWKLINCIILQQIEICKIVLFTRSDSNPDSGTSEMETENGPAGDEVVENGWLAGWLFGFNGPLRQYFSLYRVVSQREVERREKIVEKKLFATLNRTYCTRRGPCPTIIQMLLLLLYWCFTSTVNIQGHVGTVS